ncbi:hypothetical protein AGABI1DRAFT_85401 [Agaricus bisporus var. burnettii JB137-S8]|uniref:Uncharacterized protein n=1 Tax=Agaricus bisporus var. burnettii (strain JB137-S8 / ATCC MYA-4627 / FGSC 10392) TaxID=597362 RepID=K5VYP1_AGABU|nr:uncharacterized protein AGABI1DRAFT_85401 [Agaricus bisporus var. burnettii JB137-S8]EKM79579.1 hypothetical protein AGABI1DRAFT_85401 [Agaricus bisporus var. burnettii JB137-S8]
MDMSVMNPAPVAPKNLEEGQEPAHHQHKASRFRGGGGAKDCLLGMLACFICCECCEGCCECLADIVCCPCEMCC